MTAAAAMSYPIKEILGQKKRKYLVDWEGANPDTGLPWPQSWEPRANLNADALSSWKEATRKRCRKLDTMCDNDGGSKRVGAVNAQPEEEAQGWSVLESAQTETSARGSGSSSWHAPEPAAPPRVGDTTDGNSAVQGAATGPVQALNMAENKPRERGTPSQLSGSTPALVAQKWGATLSLQPPVAGVANSQVVASAVPWHPFAQPYDNCSSSQHPPLAREIPGATPGNAVTTWIETPLQQIDNYTRTSPPERADSSLLIQQSISVSSSEAHAPNEARDQSSGKTTRSPEYLKPTRCAGLAQPTPEPPTILGYGSTPTSLRDPSDGEGLTYSVAQLSVYGTSNVQKDESVRRSLVIPTVPLDGITASQWACTTLPPPASEVVEGSGDIDTFSEVGAAAVFPDLAGSGCVKTTPTSHVKLVNTLGSPKSPLLPTANPYSIPISLDEELDRFAAAFGVTPGVVIGQVALFQRRKDEGGWYEHPAL